MLRQWFCRLGWLLAVLGFVFGVILASSGQPWLGMAISILPILCKGLHTLSESGQYSRGLLLAVPGFLLGTVLIDSGWSWQGTAVSILSILYWGLRTFGKPGEFKTTPHEEGARLRSWTVPLHRFRFHHEPYRRETGPDSFIGREALCRE